MAAFNGNLAPKLFKLGHISMLSPVIRQISVDSVHFYKHWNPLFKKHRAMKVHKIKLPNFHEKEEDVSKEEYRSRMKAEGISPGRPWMERSYYLSCTGGIFEAYVPPEGDGKKSIISAMGAKQRAELMEKKSKLIMSLRKIRSFDDEFSAKEFPMQALDIYIQAHTYLAERDRIKLREFVSDRCYPQMRYQMLDKTISWKYLRSIDPPKLVHAKTLSVISKDNFFAQITVRIHSQQQLAIYDRFGRLMHGSEFIAKDVLEYCVFEKHISNLYGTWKLHDKIVPPWMPEREPSRQTLCRQDAPIDVGISTEKKKQTDEALEKVAPEPGEEKPLAIA